jgi:hypothetical protein
MAFNAGFNISLVSPDANGDFGAAAARALNEGQATAAASANRAAIDAFTIDGRTLLANAASAGRLSEVRDFVLQKGADPRVRSPGCEGYNVLHESVFAQQADVARFLLEHDPTLIETRSQSGFTALHLVALKNNNNNNNNNNKNNNNNSRQAMIEELVRAVYNVNDATNTRKATPLHIAIERSVHAFDIGDAVEALLSAGADMMLRDENNKSAMAVALANVVPGMPCGTMTNCAAHRARIVHALINKAKETPATIEALRIDAWTNLAFVGERSPLAAVMPEGAFGGRFAAFCTPVLVALVRGDHAVLPLLIEADFSLVVPVTHCDVANHHRAPHCRAGAGVALGSTRHLGDVIRDRTAPVPVAQAGRHCLVFDNASAAHDTIDNCQVPGCPLRRHYVPVTMVIERILQQEEEQERNTPPVDAALLALVRNAVATNLHTCAACGIDGARCMTKPLKECAGSCNKKTLYCSVQCQREHWRTTHQHECRHVQGHHQC